MMTMTTPAFAFRSGYTTQVRIGVPPEGSFTSTYSPWRGDFSSLASAPCSDGGRGSPGGAGGGTASTAAGAAPDGGAWLPQARVRSESRSTAERTETERMDTSSVRFSRVFGGGRGRRAAAG